MQVYYVECSVRVECLGCSVRVECLGCSVRVECLGCSIWGVLFSVFSDYCELLHRM